MKKKISGFLLVLLFMPVRTHISLRWIYAFWTDCAGRQKTQFKTGVECWVLHLLQLDWRIGFIRTNLSPSAPVKSADDSSWSVRGKAWPWTLFFGIAIPIAAEYWPAKQPVKLHLFSCSLQRFVQHWVRFAQRYQILNRIELISIMMITSTWITTIC